MRSEKLFLAKLYTFTLCKFSTSFPPLKTPLVPLACLPVCLNNTVLLEIYYAVNLTRTFYGQDPFLVKSEAPPSVPSQ